MSRNLLTTFLLALLLPPAASGDDTFRRLMAAADALEREAAALVTAWPETFGVPSPDADEARFPQNRASFGSPEEARLAMGRQRYRLGDFTGAVDVLREIGPRLPAGLRGPHILLLAQSLAALDRHDEAAAVLRAAPPLPQPWRAYARYNLAVALLVLGQHEEALDLLDETGRLETSGALDEELAALRDQANITLGFARLEQGAPAQAKAALNRVRLGGPFSDRALLGLGWAEWLAGEPRAAQVVWTKLAAGDPADPLVQEALLGIAQALWRLESHTQAGKHFRKAAATYQRQLARLGRLIDDMGDDRSLAGLLDDLSAAAAADRPALLHGHPLADHLGPLLLDPRFQAALNRLGTLQHLAQRLAVSGQHAAARDHRLRQLLARQKRLQREFQAYLQDLILDELLARREQLQSHLITARFELARLLDELATAEETTGP